MGARRGFARAFAFSTPVEIFREHAAQTAFENNGTRDLDLGALAGIDEDAYDDRVDAGLIAEWRQRAETGIEVIGGLLRAGTNCGSCVPELKQILGEGAEKPRTSAPAIAAE